ncbi:HAMP domain-containing protein [Heliobacterium chlorum]|uniref:histidine kinase n=1 Tax=Heliobacterium chlorum TaxID=2698 RepID=A0ABR7T294_HELCL|nr:HAMP domain-containing sensor histidine kinase [Heliobacterium chlorum]MBC9783984.1 HAMP domain-containing protein [Heliobacterium chlorum]
MIGRSIVLKIWLTLVGFSLALLLPVGWFFSNMFSDFYVQRETDDLVNKASLIAVEQDIDTARRLALALTGASAAMAAFGDSDGNITEVLSRSGNPQCADDTNPNSTIRKGRGPSGNGMGPRGGNGLGPRMGPITGQGPWWAESGNASSTAKVDLSASELMQLKQGEIITRQVNISILNIPSFMVAVPARQDGQVLRVLYVFAALEPMDETVSHIRSWVFGASALALLLSTLAAYLLSKKVARPLTILYGAAEKMRQGDFEQKIPVESDDEIGRLGQTLNTLSAELSKSLAELETKNIQLARGMQSMQDLAANVSHDLRTPLFLVQGYAEALRDDMPKTPEDRREMAGIILEESERMQRLVQDLLQLAQLESGYMPVAIEPLDPEELTRRVLRKMNTLAEEKSVQLIVQIPEHLPVIMGNGDRLTQALINLVDNALRHTPKDGQVTLEVEQTTSFLRFTVSDTGSGLAEEDIPRVWERFYRGEKSRTRKIPGTGLGLAIVKAIIESHGGQVGAANNGGPGARFYFTLPHHRTGD